jgi:hypothetical protein
VRLGRCVMQCEEEIELENWTQKSLPFLLCCVLKTTMLLRVVSDDDDDDDEGTNKTTF